MLIWFSVRKGLSPLNAMARTLEMRPASDLSPLPDDDSPTEIKPMIRSLNGLFERVSAARAHERDFTAFAAHELRTPIAGLKTQAQIALGSDAEPVRNAALRQIIVGVDRTSRLVRQLTDLTNAESSHMQHDRHGLNAGLAMARIAEDIARLYPHAARIVIADALGELTLQANDTLFMLATRNLLENAVQHSPADQVVTCSLRRGANTLSILIEDCGPAFRRMNCRKPAAAFSVAATRPRWAAGSGWPSRIWRWGGWGRSSFCPMAYKRACARKCVFQRQAESGKGLFARCPPNGSGPPRDQGPPGDQGLFALSHAALAAIRVSISLAQIWALRAANLCSGH